MPGIRRFLLLVVTLAVMLIAVRSADAVPGCPFCAPGDPPFSDRLAQCDAAVLVKWVSLTSNEELATETTTFEIVEVVRAGKQPFKKGDTTTWGYGRDGEPGNLFLLFGKYVDDKLQWEQPVEMTEIRYGYLRQVPPPEAADRLEFFLKFLEFSDPEIASDAFAEISKAEFKDVAALAPKLPREKLRKWLASDDLKLQVRLGLYGMLLGLSGDDNDAAFLETLIMSPPDPQKPRFGIDGMMAGYILIRGKPGLDRLLAAKFDDPKAEDDLLPLRSALTFVWDYAQDRVPAESLRAAMRRYLDRPSLAMSVIVDLARWKDWSSLDRLVQGYGREPFDSSLAKQKIIAFALTCEKDGRKTSPKALPASAIRAREFLNGLDPDLVRGVERSFGGLRRPTDSSQPGNSPAQ